MRSWLVVSESAEEVMAAGVRWLEKGQGQASVDADLSGLDDRLPARVFLALELGELLGRAGHHLVADRKSTRLNSSHLVISYAVFCLKKKRHGAMLPALTDIRAVRFFADRMEVTAP